VTAGQELLVYSLGEEGWRLDWQRSLPAPILGLHQLDMTGDGLRELVVVTTRGVQVRAVSRSRDPAQVLQADLEAVKEVTLERLGQLVAALTL
jgi:hypothetical protein